MRREEVEKGGADVEGIFVFPHQEPTQCIDAGRVEGAGLVHVAQLFVTQMQMDFITGIQLRQRLRVGGVGDGFGSRLNEASGV